MKYKLLVTVLGASMAFATPANAEVANVSAFEKTQAEACAKAKSQAQRIYGRYDVIKGFGSCQCSAKRSSSGSIYGYNCNVDVYYEPKD